MNEISGVAKLLSVNPIVELPYTQYTFNNTDYNNFGVIFGHGLGAKNPKLRTHLTDNWGSIIVSSVKPLGISTTLYTARGHGDSHGWEESSNDNLDQFTWNKLSYDMNSIATFNNYDKYIACGSSMGSATSLYAAIHFPSKVSAVIMIRPPTAWKSRLDRRSTLLGSAKKLEEKEKSTDDRYHNVLIGTAYSDLPSIEDNADIYNNIKIPFLILTIKNDDSHPVSTAKALHTAIKSSHLYIAESDDEALATWPRIIEEFVKQVLEKSVVI